MLYLPKIAQRPRLFQFTFEASLFTLRANGPQMTPLFELPPEGLMFHRFCLLKNRTFYLSIFARNNPERYSLILLFVYSRYSSVLSRGIFSSFHLFNAQRPRLYQPTDEAAWYTWRANGPQRTPSFEAPPE